MAADPSDVTFTWQFNNNGESFDVSPARFATTSGNMSELMYSPTSQRDYGTLTCWGKNSIGRQVQPCVFQVVPAGWYFLKNFGLRLRLRLLRSNKNLLNMNVYIFSLINTKQTKNKRKSVHTPLM